MTFSYNFPNVLSSTIGLYTFADKYVGLFGLGIITEFEVLRYFGQCPMLMQALPTRTNNSVIPELRHKTFQCFHVIWSGPGAEELEQPPRASNISF